MAEFYCRVCMVRKVARDGDVCPNCEDPYQGTAPAAQPVQAERVQGQAQKSRRVNAEGEQAPGSTMARSRGRSILNTTANAAPQQTQAKRIVYQQPEAPQEAQEAPTYVKADPGVIAPTGAGQQQQSAVPKAKNAPQCEGIVRNIQESKDNSSVFERWMRAFSTGTPFAVTDDMIEFQVFSGWNSGVNSATGYAADKVIVYGTINSGKPVQDNSVRVYGKRDKGNAIIASAIENTTDGTYAQFKPEPIPAGVVKVITFLLLGLLAFVVYFIISLCSGFGGIHVNTNAIANSLFCIVLLFGSGCWFLHSIKRLFVGMRSGNVDYLSTLISLIVAAVVFISALESMF